MSTVRRLQVSTGSGHEYPVILGAGAIERLGALLAERAPAHRYALIADDTVAGLHGTRVARHLVVEGREPLELTFRAGEASKTRATWARLTDAMLSAGLGRDTCVVALGGGVTGDLAGFVAATFMRGVPVVQVPTSLVAMIDASVGGKTGVDAPAGKNLVGAFHPPGFVLADPELARTLPRDERSQGLAEALKHGAILDHDYMTRIVSEADALLEGEPDVTHGVVERSVELKARIVSEDELEGGIRQTLNFGHTLGHAVEQVTGYAVPHGSAVALGMVLEARLGEELGVTQAGSASGLARAVRRLELPATWVEAASRYGPFEVDSDPHSLALGLVAATATDKKARGGLVRYVLLEELGRVSHDHGWSRPVPGEAVIRAIESLLGPDGPELIN